MKFGSRIILFLFFMIPWKASAGELITMDQVVKEAIQTNPQLAAVAAETKAALARPAQSATPPDPNVMVQFNEVPISTIDVGRGMNTEYMVEQQIPFPAKLVYGYKAEKRNAEAARAREHTAFNEIVHEVKAAYLDLYRLDEERRVEANTLALYRQNKASSETAYASQLVSIGDPVRASIDAGETEARLILIEEERTEALAQLSSLINKTLDPQVQLASPPSPPPIASLKDLLARAISTRPEIAESQKMVEEGKARVRLAKSQFGPDLTLRFSYLDIPNQENAWTGRLMASIPLWSFSKQRLAVRESKALLQRAEALRQATALGTQADITSAYARFTAAAKLVAIYGNQVPRAEIAFASSREMYRAGKGTILNVIDGIRTLRDSQMMLIRAKADQGKAYADIERMLGAPPTKETLP